MPDPSRTRSLTRSFRRSWRRIAEALPPFPRFPTPRRIAIWWRRNKEEATAILSPRLPSREDVSAWLRDKRHEQIIPPLPRPPSPKKIGKFLRRDEQLLPPVPLPPSPKKIFRWFKARQQDEFAGPLLPVRSPADLVASFMEQSRRRRRRILLSLLAVVILAVAARFAGPPVTHRIKAWQARRLATEAAVLIDQQNWGDVSKKLRAAFQLAPMEPETWRAYARLLSRTGQGPLAIEWWQKFGQTRKLSVDDRRDYAAAALSANELGIASEQISSLLAEKGGSTPRDILLAGQFATLRGYNSTAVGHANHVLADDRAGSREKLGANLIILSNTAPESPEYRAAAKLLLNIARDESDPSSPQALAVLAQQKGPARLTGTTNDSLSIATPEVSNDAMSLRELADRLDRNANSKPFHRMLALELRARAEPSRENEFVSRALKDYGKGDDETLIALGSWLYSRRHFDTMLEILPLERAVQRRELLMERIDALAALNRLAEVKDLLLSEYPVLESSFEHMYLAVVSGRLGETQAVDNEWYRALDTAKSPRTLIGLAEYAQKMGVLPIADDAYNRLITKQPGLKSGYLARLQLAEARGQTSDAHNIATEIVRLWPEDNATRVRELYLRLLLDTSGAQAAEGEKEAQRLVTSNPWDGSARTALALARLRQHKAAAALAALTEFTPGVPSSAISVAVYAAALNANGWKEKAQEQIQTLTTVNVLPEERALIKPLANVK